MTYLDVNDVSFLVDAHVNRQGNWACEANAADEMMSFSKRVVSASKYQMWVWVSLCLVGYKLLTMLAEWSAEHVPGPSPLASGVRHDA